MRRALLLAACAVLLRIPAAADETILSSGAPADRLDLVFLGDGYTASELPLYKDDVRRFVDHLFSQPPFSTYKNLFNVHRVDVASPQSGADDACAGKSVDTVFDAGYSATGVDCRLLFTQSATKVYAAAARAAGYDPGSGLIVVIANTAAYGGAATAGGYVVVYRGDSGPEALAHELGHSFGLLADEYEQTGRTYSGGEPVQLNVTVQTDRSLVKWSQWIKSGTPIPTAPALGGTGLYEGGMIFQYGVFRPTFDSKMRSLNRPYDEVNEALLIARMDAWLPPAVTLSSPAAGERVSGRVTVSAQAEDGVGLARMDLLVDGKLVGTLPASGTQVQRRWDWDADGWVEGPHALTIRAVDTAGNAADKTVAVTAGPGSPPIAARADGSRRLLFLTPGLKDGVNDEASIDSEAESVTVFDVSGRVVHASSGRTAWDGAGAESGVYVARARRRDGTETYRTVMVVR